MNIRLLLLISLSSTLWSCTQTEKKDEHDAHTEPKVQYTAYTTDYEVFAEADPFVAGDSANVLAHFTHIPGFTALDSASVSMVLSINGKETRQTLDKPTRKGIFSFDIVPDIAGKALLRFEITYGTIKKEISIPQVEVFDTEEKADAAAEKIVVSRTNTAVFTKEQSWKVDFSTETLKTELFGQVIKTTGQVESSSDDAILVTAKTDGIVIFTNNALLEGMAVTKGMPLFSISGNDFAENNTAVRFAEAENNYIRIKADYERAVLLAKDKIVADKELTLIKNQYENARISYENLKNNFNTSGQRVKAPMNGFVTQVLAKNGMYVQAGQTILTISQNKSLQIMAEVAQKYAGMLATVHGAAIRSVQNDKVYTLEELNGRIISYGKSVNPDNFMIPVHIQIQNTGNFTSGSFVEIFLKTDQGSTAITVPNTALLEEQGVFFVFVQINPELFEKREVMVGGTDGIRTEIRKGIKPEERFVSRGAVYIKLAQATGTLDAHSGHVH
jgi:cobalt-zinc-cadmium efflux system membrane fusion protein